MSENEIDELHRMDESTPEAKETGSRAELEYIWDDIIVHVLEDIPRSTAGEVADVAESRMKKEIDGVLRSTVKRNVANAIGDALEEVKKHFMEITKTVNQEEEEK